MEEIVLKKKNKKKCRCNYFSDFEVPPCAKFLGNNNPIVKDGKVIYRNDNRLYFFLSYNYSKLQNQVYNPLNPLSFNTTTHGNLQIELYCFLIGWYINEIEKGNVNYDSSISIHDDKNADKFIKELIENNHDLNTNFIPSLSYIISNTSAIVPFYFGSIEISITNFYIILMLSRFNSDYGLLFSDNSYATNDFINNTLANIYAIFNNCNE